jgi:hypothetical protein
MKKRTKSKSANPLVLRAFFESHGLPAPVAEYRFAPPRKWRFDWAWPALAVALEVEGGIWTRGRHVSPKGFLADMEKYNAATRAGWAVLRVTPQDLLTKATAEMVGECWVNHAFVAGTAL